MSFFCNFQSDRCPGQINGNPLNGLCEKVCIQVKKVFDACMQQTQLTDIVLNLTNFTPANPTYPLTFISAKSTVSQGTISNLLIDPLPERQGSARVKADVTIPISVAYTDANGVSGSGTTTITVPVDVILFVPQPSIVPFRIEAFGASSSPIGQYVGNTTFSITACITVILRVVVEAEILVPSYGYCSPPTCQEFTQDVCQGNAELPIFPTAIQNQRI